MKMERMKRIPQTREDFERNMFMLRDKIEKGEHHIHEGQAHSLIRLRKLPNNRINFLTVDETARLKANHLASMMDMDINEFLKNKDEHNTSE